MLCLNTYTGHGHWAQTISMSGIDYHTILGSAHEIADFAKYNEGNNEPKNKGSLKFHANGVSGGFGALDFDSEGKLVMTHYDGNGTKLYSAKGRAPRAAASSCILCMLSSLFSRLAKNFV